MARAVKHRKKRFSFSCLGKGKSKKLDAGDKGDDVRALQTFLTETGYLPANREPGVLCSSTSDALKMFQSNYGLKQSGIGDTDTLKLMQRPRCGVPDLPDPEDGSELAPFVLRGCKYDELDLTYAFLNDTPDLSRSRQRAIVAEAFDAWAEVTQLTFTEVSPSDDPTFVIGFERGNHGDGSSFDDDGSISGNTLAHAFFPPPCGGPNAGVLHFDEFENWTDQSAGNSFRLLNVAIHEIGHLLGLSHSDDEDAVMFAFYDDNVDSLGKDDVAGIQTLYGAPAGSVGVARRSINGVGQRNGGSVEVVLRNGRRIYAPQDISSSALERIIRVAEAD
ncbi:MAG: matrixin family metalloprotease [Hyphomicrobiaceae bacterium]